MDGTHFGTDYDQIFGLVCGTEKVPDCKRRTFSIPKHVPIGMF